MRRGCVTTVINSLLQATSANDNNSFFWMLMVMENQRRVMKVLLSWNLEEDMPKISVHAFVGFSSPQTMRIHVPH